MKKIILFLSLIVFLCSCAPKAPFTYEIKDKYGLTHEDLKEFQFYLSHELLLRKQTITTREEKISDTEIRIYQDRAIKEVIFKKGTRGVVKSIIEDDFLLVKLEDGAEYLLFGNPGKRGKYYLIGDKTITGELYYGGELFKMINYKLAFAKEPAPKKYSQTELREMLNRKRSAQKTIKPDQIVTYYPYLLLKNASVLEKFFNSKKNRRVVSGKQLKTDSKKK